MTALNAAVESSLTTIRSINENIAKLQEEAKAARAAAVEPFLDALAASGEVSLIVIWGYTPGFNDGEPCEHSSDYVINVDDAMSEDIFDRDMGLEELGEKLQDDDGDITAESCRAAGHVFGRASDTIRKAIKDVIFDTVEEEEGTDYYVAYVLEDGKFVKREGEYTCGY